MVSGAASNASKIFEERKKKQEEQKKKDLEVKGQVDNDVLAYSSIINKEAGLDTSLDIQTAFKQTLPEITALSTKIHSGKASADDISRYSTLTNNATKLPQNLLGEVHIAGSSYSDAQAKGSNVMGGLYDGAGLSEAQKADYDNYVDTMQVLSQKGYSKINSTVSFLNADNSDMSFEMNAKGIDGSIKNKKLVYSAIKYQNEKRPNGMYTVPDASKDMLSVVSACPDIFTTKNDKNGNPQLTGGINISWAQSNNMGVTKQVHSGTVNNQITGQPIASKVSTVFEPDFEKISKQPSIQTQVSATVNGMLKTDPTGLAILYNSVLADKKSKDYKPLDIFDSNAMKDNIVKIQDAYALYTVKNQLTQKSYPVTNEAGEPIVIHEKYVKPTAPKSNKAEINKNEKQADLQTVFNDAKANGGVFGQARYNKTTGKWSKLVYDEDGIMKESVPMSEAAVKAFKGLK